MESERKRGTGVDACPTGSLSNKKRVMHRRAEEKGTRKLSRLLQAGDNPST